MYRKTLIWRDEERALVDQFRQASISQIKSLVPKAIEALEETVGSTGPGGKDNLPRDRIRLSVEILDRAGIVKPHEVEEAES